MVNLIVPGVGSLLFSQLYMSAWDIGPCAPSGVKPDPKRFIYE
jgi:hypothetical protein